MPIASDECYAEFTWAGPPRSILEHGSDGMLAVHSSSKRSNLAGLRAGFYAGDEELVNFLKSVRQHAGFMVPAPIQAAVAVAYGDDPLDRRKAERNANTLGMKDAAMKDATLKDGALLALAGMRATGITAG